MIQIGARRVSIMVLACITLHLWWTMLLCIDAPAAVSATPLAALSRWSPNYLVLGLVLATVATLAFMSLLWRNRARGAWLLLPQQIVMMASAAGGISAMYLGQYADGVLRSPVFISSDQILIVIMALGHTIAIISHAEFKPFKA